MSVYVGSSTLDVAYCSYMYLNIPLYRIRLVCVNKCHANVRCPLYAHMPIVWLDAENWPVRTRDPLGRILPMQLPGELMSRWNEMKKLKLGSLKGQPVQKLIRVRERVLIEKRRAMHKKLLLPNGHQRVRSVVRKYAHTDLLYSLKAVQMGDKLRFVAQKSDLERVTSDKTKRN